MDTSHINNAVEHLSNELRNLRANRANPALFEDLPVQAYGATMKMLEVASITTPEPQLAVIQPWDKSLIKEIETAIRESQLQLNPVVDGEIVRVAFPQLTEEKRKELVKVMHSKCEEARIAVRKIREDILKDYKEQEKAGSISEDEYFRNEKDVQKAVDDVNEKIKQLSEQKEKELMTV